MTANTLPSGIGDLAILATHIGTGLAAHSPWLGTLPSAAAFHETLRKLTESEDAYAIARAGKAAAGTRFHAADDALTAWLGKARLVLMLAKGAQWSETWVEAGFTQRGTNVPKQMAARVALVPRVAGFFTRNGEWEMPVAGVTAAHGAAVSGEMRAAQAGLRAASQDALVKKRARDLAEKTLRWEMRRVVIFLSVLLSPGDARWLAFGLNRPRPDAPVSVAARRSGVAAAVIALPPAEPARAAAAA